MTVSNCITCKYSALNSELQPCKACLAAEEYNTQWQSVQIEELQRTERSTTSPHRLTRYGNAFELSTADLVEEAVSYGTDVSDNHQELRIRINNLAGIIARMIHLYPIADQLKLLNLEADYQVPGEQG